MSKVKTKWQKKQPQYNRVKLQTEKPVGLSELASWLDTSKPSEVLDDLRKFQEDWCAHSFKLIGTVRIGDRVKQIYSCSKCSAPNTTSRIATNG